jgi:L-ascorbate metabolism protein UlaG (beta-lactamase superfamily)
MKIKYYGHAAFRLTTEGGTRVIIDPYQSGAFGGALGYGKIEDEADVVLISHGHEDHNCTDDLKGDFRTITAEGTYKLKDLTLRALPFYHDGSKGSERGENLVFVLEADGMTVVHVGDLGHMLDAAAISRIGRVDVLLVPVGGFFTIDAASATTLMSELKAKVTIPMHYLTEKCGFPIAPVDDFIAGKEDVKRAGTPEIDIAPSTLPTKAHIIVLPHAL